ncbi:MAG: DUF2341 domain-containing protein [Promethearchaeota archaeon]
MFHVFKNIKTNHKSIYFFCILITLLFLSLFYDKLNPEVQLHNQNKLKQSNDHEFNFYKSIIINPTSTSELEVFESFPILLSLFDADLKDHAQSDGDDIAFFYEDQQLNHEIENYNPNYNRTHSHLIAWIRIPKIPTKEPIEIIMKFGNSLVESQENSEAVWDIYYVGAWHFSENDMGIAGDSTSNDNDGRIIERTLTDETTPIANLDDEYIGPIADFSNDIESIIVSDDESLNMAETITISFWLKLNNIDERTSNTFILSKGTSEKQAYAVSIDPNGNLVFSLNEESESDDKDNLIYLTPLEKGTWIHVTCIQDGEYMRILIDGVEVALKEYEKKIKEVPGPLTIGSSELNGSINELRISNVARSADWIYMETINQESPQDFVNVSTCEIIPESSGNENVPIVDQTSIIIITVLSISTISLGITAGYLRIQSSNKKKKEVSKFSNKYEKYQSKKTPDSNVNMGVKKLDIIHAQVIIEKPQIGPLRPVQVACPRCRAMKEINLPENLVTETSTITTVSVPKNLICEHPFMFFLDRHFEIRGYESVDYQIRIERLDKF